MAAVGLVGVYVFRFRGSTVVLYETGREPGRQARS
jgi:hypothetical protein